MPSTTQTNVIRPQTAFPGNKSTNLTVIPISIQIFDLDSVVPTPRFSPSLTSSYRCDSGANPSIDNRRKSTELLSANSC